MLIAVLVLFGASVLVYSAARRAKRAAAMLWADLEGSSEDPRWQRGRTADRLLAGWLTVQAFLAGALATLAVVVVVYTTARSSA
jgi:hypothetical protein